MAGKVNMKQTWPELIIKNFEDASRSYSQAAEIQRTFAWILAQECSRHDIPKGIWADLGTGTGLLAEALEKLNPNQSVIRVDASQGMLNQHHPKAKKLLHDLNQGSPQWPSKPALIASNFCLQWLQEPSNKVQEWFSALVPGGYLAFALPIKGSFPEWYQATQKAEVAYTAADLPMKESLISGFDNNQILYQKLHRYTQKAPKVLSLLKPFKKLGAQGTSKSSLCVKDWRRLEKAWPRLHEDGEVSLTWLVQLALVRR